MRLLIFKYGNRTLVSVLPDTHVTAIFDDGSIMDSGGCNDYQGGYEVKDDHISIGPLASNLAFCADPEGIMEQEASFFLALESAARFQIVADRLELVSEIGELSATFDLVSSSNN